ncbi:35357_t:CDS:2, partial [Racocetra persica]
MYMAKPTTSTARLSLVLDDIIPSLKEYTFSKEKSLHEGKLYWKNRKTVSSCNMCRTLISNKNRNKAKENIEKEIKRHQNLAYTQDQLTDVLLDFLDPYEDFDNAKLCSQVLNIDIAVFLNSFIDHIETSNEDELNKLIAYRIIKLVSKADGF